MQSDCPAALPLIAFIAGLLAGHSYPNALGFIAIAALLFALRRVRPALIAFAVAGGLCGNPPPAPVSVAEDRFTTIEAAIDRDWMQRGSVYLLRVRDLTILTRFEPPPIRLEKSVVAEGFVRRGEHGDLLLVVKSPRLLHYAGRAPWWSPATWNRALANRLRPFARAYPTEVALAEALALGRGERLVNEVRDRYKRAGTYHLLVFSGLQIAFAAGALAAMLRWLHAPRIADWSLLFFAIGAPLFIGPNASVSRASIAIGLYAFSRILHRPTTLENLWCVAALVRLIAAPSDIGDAAFQLTYGGAGALLFVAKPLAKRPVRWLVYAAGVECIVTVLTLFHFHQYALGGSATTLLLTPLISAMLVVAMLACAFPCPALFHGIGWLHAAAMRINDVSAHAAGAFAAPERFAFAAGLIGALAAIAWTRGRIRAFLILTAMAIPLASAILVARRDVDAPTITFLDVGQGDALLIRTPGNAILVDGGPSPSRIVPLLADRGVHRIDTVVLTHAHPDHCGGLPAVLSRFDVRHLWITPRRFLGDCAQELLRTASMEQVPIHFVREGDRIVAGAVSLRAIIADQTFRRSPENNSSIVLRMAVGKRSALLTGDVESDQERNVAGEAGCIDVLKAAHHGSRTSSMPLLLDATAPRLAIISCGRHNLFGHPHLQVLEALRSRRIRVWRTDVNGTVEVAFRGGRVLVRPQIDTP